MSPVAWRGWTWSPGRGIEVHVLRGGAYVASDTSMVLPRIELGLLARFVSMENQSEAVRAYRKALRDGG